MSTDDKAEQFVAQFKRKHKCLTCGAIGIPDPIKGCTRCGWDDMEPVDEPPADGIPEGER